MSAIVDRIVQTKSLLESAASLVVLLLQYVALSSLLTLPGDVSGLAQILSFALTITITLMIFVLSKALKGATAVRVALVALLFTVAGTGLAINSSLYAGRVVVAVPATCVAAPPGVFIVPAPPFEHPLLTNSVLLHEDFATALCDVEDQRGLRAQIERENDGETTQLILRLVLAQLFLVTGILVVAWKVILHNRKPARAPGPAAPRGRAPRPKREK